MLFEMISSNVLVGQNDLGQQYGYGMRTSFFRKHPGSAVVAPQLKYLSFYMCNQHG